MFNKNMKYDKNIKLQHSHINIYTKNLPFLAKFTDNFLSANSTSLGIYRHLYLLSGQMTNVLKYRF